MASSVLSEYLNKKVAVISTDGSLYVGYLEGYDHSTNIVLRHTVRRDLSPKETSADEKIGLFVIRGDCVSVIGKVDLKRDASIDWDKVVAEPLHRFK